MSVCVDGLHARGETPVLLHVLRLRSVRLSPVHLFVTPLPCTHPFTLLACSSTAVVPEHRILCRLGVTGYMSFAFVDARLRARDGWDSAGV